MKVKVAELKAHLSKYLRRVRESDEPVEIYLREEPVAYLVSQPGQPADGESTAALKERLRQVGLGLAVDRREATSPAEFQPRPRPPGDKGKVANSVVSMRGEKDY
ncbi:MAG: type II toxin-antitoxin system prevent-host-death family antitoxin [Verrucomicrobia bacterium]|jgi:prevent-host-death family protein|nr:type II toxin-antitoxin system prevent-host-death family antitoxin [Verrucomicrobiota bacterium]